MPTVEHKPLRRLAQAIVLGTGSAPAEALAVANHLVDANLAGHDSHGVGMLPTYVAEVAQGRLCPNTPSELLRDDGAFLAFDGQRGYGQRAAGEATLAAIDRAQAQGVCVMTLRNAGHIGRVGAYGELAAAAGLFAMYFVNVTDHPPSVAPHGAREARYNTNPLCVAVPDGQGGTAVLLDMATSRYALGKVRIAKNKAATLPPGMLLDADGKPDTDPAVMYAEPRGALLPFGEHKGSGLALVCELLAGVLSGNGTLQPDNPQRGGLINNLFSVLVEPRHLVDDDWMGEEVTHLLDYVRSAHARAGMQVQIAGEPEAVQRAQRLRSGIPVDDTTWREITTAAAEVGVDSERMTRLLSGPGE